MAAMKLLDRYVLRELGVPFCAGIAIGVLLLVGTLLFTFAGRLLERGVPLALVFQFLIYRAPSLSVMAIPMAMAFAVSLAMNRLGRDSEVTALHMAGISFRRLALPIFAAGLAGSALSLVVAEEVAPRANVRSNAVWQRMWSLQMVPALEPNTVIRAHPYTFYIGRRTQIDRERYRLNEVLIYDSSHQPYPVWYVVPEATTTPRCWILKDVIRRDFGKDGMSVHETYLPELRLDLERDVPLASFSTGRDELPARALLGQSRTLQAAGESAEARRMLVDYHFRFALPLACLVFSLLSAPLSFRFSRGGSFVGVLVSIAVGFLYYNALILTRDVLGYTGALPPVVAAWAQDVLFGTLAVVLVWRSG